VSYALAVVRRYKIVNEAIVDFSKACRDFGG